MKAFGGPGQMNRPSAEKPARGAPKAYKLALLSGSPVRPQPGGDAAASLRRFFLVD
jgi:hypothetical protein